MSAHSTGALPNLRLYHYWRSSSSWRVRWALALKEIPCEYVAVDLLSDAPETPEHLARNPLGFVPVLERPDSPARERFLPESLAIAEWLEELRPTPSLFWGDAWNRARTRALAEIIAADTQPLQNLNPQHLHSDDPKKRADWARHWTRRGLEAYEKFAATTHGRYSVGDQVTLADLCLVPQIYNAGRQEIDVAREFPLLHAIASAALETPAARASHPDRFAPGV